MSLQATANRSNPGEAPSAPEKRATRGRIAVVTVSCIVFLAAFAVVGISYTLGWLGLGMATLLPLAALVALGATTVGALRHKIALNGWRESSPAAQQRLIARASGRSAGWVLIGCAAYVSLPRSMMSSRDIHLGIWVIACSVIVLVLLTAVPRTRSFGVVTAMIVALAALAGWQLVKLAVPPGSGATIQAPVAGEWVVQTGGNSVLINHHYPLRQQRYALDLAVPYSHNDAVRRETLWDFPAFGMPVTSPVTGEVVRVEADRPDQAIGDMDPEHPLGNFVVVQLAEDRFVLMAHLKAGSVTVEPGDLLDAGDRIAAVGNSGNSSEPHLHIQVQTGPDLLNDNGTGWADIDTIPFSFADSTGDVNEDLVPRMDDRILMGGQAP